MEAPSEVDLLASLEPPTVDQYWLSEEELHAITVDPDLGAAFGNPYIPPATALNPQDLLIGAPQVVVSNRGGSNATLHPSFLTSVAHVVESPVSSPSSTPSYPLSPPSASTPSGSGEDDGSDERPSSTAAGKRRKHAEEKDIDLTFLAITKDQLAIISSKQLDSTVQRVVASGRKFTADERKAITAARRRIKNREYARDMRDKQSKTMTDLSGRVTELETENVLLKSQVSALVHENSLLKSQLGIAPTAGSHYVAATGRSVLGKRGTPQIAAGACLLVLLFSFGFYFNFTSPTPFDPALQGRSGVSTGRVLLHQAEAASQWSVVAALQRALFAWRYGNGSGAQCQCDDLMRGMVCIDKSDFRDLSKRCDLSGISKHEE